MTHTPIQPVSSLFTAGQLRHGSTSRDAVAAFHSHSARHDSQRHAAPDASTVDDVAAIPSRLTIIGAQP